MLRKKFVCYTCTCLCVFMYWAVSLGKKVKRRPFLECKYKLRPKGWKETC